MITVRRAKERRHIRRRMHEVWFSFYPHPEGGPLAGGFGALEAFNEDRLPPGAGVTLRPQHDAEIVTYVREGALAHEDSGGRSGVLRADEFQRVSAGRGLRHSETNPSGTDWTHVFQMWLHPSQAGLRRDHEQRRFDTSERRGALRLVASPNGRGGSLGLRLDALIYSALIDAGRHVAHELAPGRSAWVHVVRGEAKLDQFVLATGDGAGVRADRSVSIEARPETEILLLDLPG
jgi:redox-sensitive bicupin YhaK (pirin superfamily)